VGTSMVSIDTRALERGPDDCGYGRAKTTNWCKSP
jgi:hypothetical protein